MYAVETKHVDGTSSWRYFDRKWKAFAYTYAVAYFTAWLYDLKVKWEK
jgi:hypothetical protein